MLYFNCQKDKATEMMKNIRKIKENKMMKDVVKIAKVVTKILEVFHWVAVVLMIAATVCSLTATDWVKYFVGFDAKECCGVELSVYGFEIITPLKNGSVDMTVLFLFGIGAVMLLSLMAMVFRNINLIIKKSEDSTPFQADNIRMLKEIGIYAIAIPVISLIMSVVCRVVLGIDAVETSVNVYGFSMGVIILCLTQFFIYGARLENDVEGLL